MKLKNIITIIISLSLFYNTASAECLKPVTSIKKGTSAPCDGYIFTPEAEAENYRKLEQSKLYKELSENQEEQNNLVQERLNNYIQYSNDLNSELRKQQVRSDLTKVVYFLAGALVMYGAYEVANHGR